jgi:hypothetical protein
LRVIAVDLVLDALHRACLDVDVDVDISYRRTAETDCFSAGASSSAARCAALERSACVPCRGQRPAELG